MILGTSVDIYLNHSLCYNACYNILEVKMSAVKIRKIGNSLGFIIPKELQEAMNASEGDLLDLVKIGDGELLLKSHLPHHSQWSFDNIELQDEKDWIESETLDEDDYAPEW